jgi:citrate/tricarballylate utilization protein
MKGFFKNNGLVVSLVTALAVMLVLFMALLFRGGDVLFASHIGQGAFYQVIPYVAMVIPFSVVGVLLLISLWKGFANFWCATGGTTQELKHWPAHLQAVWDVLRLRYLDGGGHGCNYPDDEFSMIRRNFHHAIFYGFMLCFASTTTAFFYDHILHISAPYPFWSLPVLLGTIGGLGLLVGTSGMLYLKWKMDKIPASQKNMGMDVVFTLLLLLTSLTGLLLLALRTTPAMGFLLAIHIGFVLGLFITMPYGKFIHAVYRYAALVKNALEQARD